MIEFTVKVSNQSPTIQKGAVRLTFNDARTNKRVDTRLGNKVTDLAFEVPAKQSRTFSWKISVPDDMGVLTYTAIGGTGKINWGMRMFGILQGHPFPAKWRWQVTATWDLMQEVLQRQALSILTCDVS